MAAVIDVLSVKTTEMGGPVGYNAGKKIKGRKRHLTVDAKVFPITIDLYLTNVQGSERRTGYDSGDIEESTVIYRSWVVERTFAWLAGCRRLVNNVNGL
ncbi:MAG: hypothetical protein OXC62_12145 [Aestuariivita sp.]|nr:hypothetical protein [Aestuariivita sp.]